MTECERRIFKELRAKHPTMTACNALRQATATVEADGDAIRCELMHRLPCGLEVQEYMPENLPVGYSFRFNVAPSTECFTNEDLGSFQSLQDNPVDFKDDCLSHHAREGDDNSEEHFEFETGYQSRRDCYSELGFSKHAADNAAKQEMLEDYKRVCSYGIDWNDYHITAELWFEEDCIADDTLGGIDCNYGESDYLLAQGVGMCEGLRDEITKHMAVNVASI